MTIRNIYVFEIVLFSIIHVCRSIPVEWQSLQTQKLIFDDMENKPSKIDFQIKPFIEKQLGRNYRLQDCDFGKHFNNVKFFIVDYGNISNVNNNHVIVVEATMPSAVFTSYEPQFYFPLRLIQEKATIKVDDSIVYSTVQITSDGYDSVKHSVRYDIDKTYPTPVVLMLSELRNLETEDAATHLRNFLNKTSTKLKIVQVLSEGVERSASTAVKLPHLSKLRYASNTFQLQAIENYDLKPVGYTYAIIHHTKRHFLIYEGLTDLQDAQNQKFYNFVVTINEYVDTGESESTFQVLHIKPELYLSKDGYKTQEVQTAMKNDIEVVYEGIESGPYVEWKLPGCQIEAGSLEETLANDVKKLLKSEMAPKTQRLQRKKDKQEPNKVADMKLELGRAGRSFNISPQLFGNAPISHVWKLTPKQGERFIFSLSTRVVKKNTTYTSIMMWFPEDINLMYTKISEAISTAATSLPRESGQ